MMRLLCAPGPSHTRIVFCPHRFFQILQEPNAHTLAADLQFSGDRCKNHLSRREQPRGTLAALLQSREVSSWGNRGRHASIMDEMEDFVTVLYEIR
jgi:hypothetical protein